MKPKRIQLSRTKGWKMPPNTVKVDRTTQWGNPFTMAEFGREAAVAKYREMMESRVCLKLRRDLRGKNLACWCRLDQACHADVLIEIANGD